MIYTFGVLLFDFSETTSCPVMQWLVPHPGATCQVEAVSEFSVYNLHRHSVPRLGVTRGHCKV